MKARRIKTVYFVFLGLLIFSFAVFSFAEENSESGENIFQDIDQDGLSDEEEKTYGTDPKNNDTDGDGYSDGAEIKSGYDPLKPAPGDRIVDDSDKNVDSSLLDKAEQGEASEGGLEKKNLTEELSIKVSELINESVTGDGEISIEDIDDIIEEAVNEEYSIEDVLDESEEEINITEKEQKYDSLDENEREIKIKTDSLEYLTSVAYILANNMPQKISDPKDLDLVAEEVVSQVSSYSSSFSNLLYFKDMAERGENTLIQLESLEVPANMKSVHLKGILLAKHAIALERDMNVDISDPVSGIIILNRMQEIAVVANELTREVNQKLQSLGISEIPIEL